MPRGLRRVTRLREDHVGTRKLGMEQTALAGASGEPAAVPALLSVSLAPSSWAPVIMMVRTGSALATGILMPCLCPCLLSKYWWVQKLWESLWCPSWRHSRPACCPSAV